jgi:hypothetical protein
MQNPLTLADWNRLEDAVAGTSFWRLDPDEEFRPMFDGSDWTIRGRQGGRSPCIKRRSPYGPIRDLALRDAYVEALDAYRRKDWEKALAGFEECLAIVPCDAPSKLFLERVAQFRVTAPCAAWTGVWSLMEK